MELYEFQAEDVDKLARQKSCLIGSEMGVGKTIQAIALDQHWYEEWAREQKAKGQSGHIYRTLVVAPLNTFSSWLDKYEKQAPDVKVLVIDRKNRKEFIEAVKKGKADVFLCHWDALRLMPELTAVQFNTIIADEVHRVSNRKAQTTIALKKLKAVHKLGLSGTASGDKPENLWSVLNWLWPSYYSSYWRFRARYCLEEMVQRGDNSYRQITGVKNQHELRKEMRPWYVRHLKREECCEHHLKGVMHWLPDKVYETVWVDLSPTQRRIYEQMRKYMVSWVGEHEESPLTASVVVAQMTRLSQMALATPEIVEDGKVRLTMPSSKMDALKEILNDNPDKSFVVFTSSKQMAYICQTELARSKISTVVLSGDTPDAERRSLVADFQSGKYRIVVGVIQAIAEGIDGLQEKTDCGIFLDRAWSTVKNKQAEDRLHREGQKDTVTIIDIMARNTVDLGRAQRIELKWQWIKQILGDRPQTRQTLDFGELRNM